MLKFVIDEDMPRSTAKILKDRGYVALDVRDHDLRGKSDEDIFTFAQNEKAVLLTGDWGFGNLLHFPVGSHSGIVIAHFPNEVSALELNQQIVMALENLDEIELKGSLIIIEPGKIRIRK